MNCLIVDDEPIARSILENYLARLPELVLVNSCKNATEAYESMYAHSVDIIFLDIQMPTITGIDFMRSLKKTPMVVFTTAFPNFAVEGFELNAIDYLVKPITFERFCQAVQKLKDRYNESKKTNAPAETVDYLFIKHNEKLLRIKHSNIHYIEAEKDFCSVYLDEKKILASMHLKMFEDTLPVRLFHRVHRSYIINLDKIIAIKGNMIELPHQEVPIGAIYKKQLMERLGL
ncbi:response regulator transcription factor [Parasegetibacter sp. MAH-26]|uniref:Response regulator transcription factor n=2 Tax=Pinibacter aurantiacus TaxID=2851599 RepID=A0A9E2SCQ1_9BACT|nr:response regulator transcription factor [Pinibacter aurantiacus]